MILVVDNYDSFTYNLVQILLKNKFAVKVIKNDEWTIEEICKKQQLIEAFLFSPGPGHPSEAKLCHQILKEFASTHPILGVCLGHQVIAEYFGARVIRAEKPMHGKVSVIEHTSQGSFKGLPFSNSTHETDPTLKVVRYHSLIVDESSLPECLDVIARVSPQVALSAGTSNLPSAEASAAVPITEFDLMSSVSEVSARLKPQAFETEASGVKTEVMALRHKTFPIEGWQFHPESILTDFGEQLVVNFFRN